MKTQTMKTPTAVRARHGSPTRARSSPGAHPRANQGSCLPGLATNWRGLLRPPAHRHRGCRRTPSPCDSVAGPGGGRSGARVAVRPWHPSESRTRSHRRSKRARDPTRWPYAVASGGCQESGLVAIGSPGNLRLVVNGSSFAIQTGRPIGARLESRSVSVSRIPVSTCVPLVLVVLRRGQDRLRPGHFDPRPCSRS